MDIDSDGSSMGMELSRVAGRVARPKMPRSELSEIMEGLDRENGFLPKNEEVDADADGEGESPGLDALATAASEMA